MVLRWLSVAALLGLAGPVLTTPLSVITNSPHGQTDSSGVQSGQTGDAANLPPVLEWENLYDKEVGTWCAPDANEAQIVATPSSQPLPSTTVRSAADPLTLVTSSGSTHQTPPSEETLRLTRWADAALRVVRGHVSDDAQGDSAALPYHRPVPSAMNLYVAPPSPTGGKMFAVLPDGPLNRAGPRDAWLVLDPTPNAAFGHVVHLFAVDLNVTDTACISGGGYPLDASGECLTQVFKNRCPNLVVRRSATWRRRSAGTATAGTSTGQRRCDIDFLPLVTVQQPAQQHDQRLLCSNDVAGFALCPSLRSVNETSELICDPLSTNHKRCDSTHELIKTRCRLFETCDQAVLLSGGWNRQMSGRHEMRRLLSVYRMLHRNGFAKDSVKIFFANGVRPETGVSEDENEYSEAASMEASTSSHRHEHHVRGANPAMYPAALKLALRNHIRTLCATSHCVDSLVIYLSSATRSDGSSLLWDADHNGEFDETEIYTVREFLRDIQDCASRQVVVLADQNHSGQLADAVARSRKHGNVLVFTSGQSHQLAWNGEFTHHWVNYHHGHTCLPQVFQDSLSAIKNSKPRFEDASNGTLYQNLFGAPCDVKPPFSKNELRTHYMGCQYVPTRIWLSRHGSATDPPPRLLSG